MKVLHVITGLRSGGAENQLLLLGRHTASQMSVIALTNADEIADALRADGTAVLELGMRSNRDLLAVLRLAAAIRHQRPDVVHVHLYRATLYGRVAAWLARVPVVVTTEHSLLDGTLEGRRTTAGVRWLYLATEAFNDATIAVSQDVADLLAGWGVRADKLTVIPNGLDAEEIRAAADERTAARSELGIPADAEVVGALGRLHHEKRLDVLLAALSSGLGAHRRVLLVGSGDHEAYLRGEAARLRISDWVHFAGTRRDVPRVLAAMDVLASASGEETFGLAVVEAALAGKPVVYVSAPAMEELGPLPGTQHVGRDEESLREGVEAALARPTESAPSEALRHYDVRTVARRVDALYASRLRSARSARRRHRRGSGHTKD